MKYLLKNDDYTSTLIKSEGIKNFECASKKYRHFMLRKSGMSNCNILSDIQKYLVTIVIPVKMVM